VQHSSLSQFSRSPRLAIAFCALIGVLLPALHGAVAGVPRPRIHDEYSYLLAADTFARGRLTNPSPALPTFFEAEHILVVPSYQSKYPPGQGLVLAIGVVLFGHPIWGVWLSCGLFAGSLCWMLQAWTSRTWALVLTTFSALTLGTATYWAQSYWGGMVAAAGAALVFGAIRRLDRAPRVGVSVLLALGLLLLANTRPFEGALAAIPAIAYWVRRIARSGSELKSRFLTGVLPAVVVLSVGIGMMGVYNHAVTGSAFLFPYSLHLQQYLHHGVFLFGDTHEPTRQAVDRIAQFFRERSASSLQGTELASQAAANLIMRLPLAVSTAFGFSLLATAAESFRSIFIWSLLLPQVWGRHSTRVLRLAFIAVSSIELLVWFRDPGYLILLAPALGLGLLTVLHAVAVPGEWMRRSLLAIVGTLAVQSLVAWWYPHYTAPLLPLVVAMVGAELRRASRRRGVSLRRHIWKLMAVGVAAQLLALGVARLGHANQPSAQADQYPNREAVARHLEAIGGQHLVMVSYASDYPLDSEWVFNGADLSGSPVLFAHRLGEDKNAELFRIMPSRYVWHLDVSSRGGQLSRAVVSEKHLQ